MQPKRKIMLDNNLKIEKKEGNDFPPLPKNIYQVELLDVNSEQRPTYDTKNKPDNEKEYETVLKFQFTLLFGRDESQTKNELKELRGRNIWENFAPCYFYVSKKNGENKTLRAVKALLGRELTQLEDAQGVSGELLNSLIGKQCRLSVEPVTKADKTYDNITDYLKIEGELTPLTEEEKEKARVKKDGEKTETVYPQGQTPIEEIPFD